jgi:hypothetical protein
MFYIAKGWSGDLTPYYLQRNLLQPNSNLLQGIPALNAYSGISPRWVVDLIGDHNRLGMLVELRTARQMNAYFQWLQALSVKWLLLIYPAHPHERPYIIDKGKTSIASYLYEIPNSLPRARFAKELHYLKNIQAIKRESVAGRLDPTKTTILHTEDELKTIKTTLDGWAQKSSNPTFTQDSVTLLTDHASQVTLKACSKNGGFLVLADTYYPGWEVLVNGQHSQIFRVNMMHRGVLVPPGTNTVTFRYRSKFVRWSILLSCIGFLSILSSICYLFYKSKESPI